MPLIFQRPPRSAFAGQRAKKQPVEHIETTPEPVELYDFFNFYPLTTEKERERSRGPTRGATQVDPLPQSRRNPLPFPNTQQNQQIRPTAPATQNPMPQMPQPMRPQFQQPYVSPAPPSLPSPPSPEQAAQHFRNINKSLPDGVMYEPLDDETMRLLRDNGHLKKASIPEQNAPIIQQKVQPSPTPAEPSSTPTIPSEIVKTIENLTQNEHNAKIFYSGIPYNTDDTKKNLLQLAEGSGARVKQYAQILRTHFNSEFTPIEKEINTNLPFENAISLAIIEENKALTTLCTLLDQVEGTSLERQIERIINKKVVAHQILLTLQTTTIPAPYSLRYPPRSAEASL